MRLLFFDTECSNCFDGKGKICEFGYILTDSDFNVIKKDNMIINPGAVFDKKGFAIQKIKLSCPYSEYYKKEKFTAYYEEIKALLTANDIIAVGHATHFDAKYILNDCVRYGLPSFNYSFIDTQEVARQIYGRETRLRLIELYSDFFPEKSHEQIHSAVSDAELTKEVLKYMCDDKKMTFSELIKRYPVLCQVFENHIVEGNAFGYVESSAMGKRNRKIFQQYVDHNQAVCDGDKYGFPSEYESKHFKQMLHILKAMTEKNLRYACVSKKVFYVTLNDREWNRRYAKKDKIVPFVDFIKLVGLSEEDLKDENIDVEEIVAELDENKAWYSRYTAFRDGILPATE